MHLLPSADDLVRQPGYPCGVSFVPPGVTQTRYQLTGVGAYWSRRAAIFLGRVLSPLLPSSRLNAARVTVKVRRVSDLNPVTRAAIRLWLAWVLSWRTRWASFDWYVTVHADRRLVSLAGVVDRVGTIGGVPTRLGLVGGVFTIPELRRRGLARDVVTRAAKLMTNDLGCEFGVLICVDGLVSFYEQLGWKRVSNAMKFERFGRTGYARSNVMVYECTGQPLPDGTIDLLGLPA
jgi:GNAT superfamily N-acetyltransferase